MPTASGKFIPAVLADESVEFDSDSSDAQLPLVVLEPEDEYVAQPGFLDSLLVSREVLRGKKSGRSPSHGLPTPCGEY